MTEWGVFGVIVTLVTFVIAVVKPIINLTQSITKLATVVEQLKHDYEEQRVSSEKSHKRIWDTVNKHEDELRDHETRIHDLERK